ncbi:hypothetical protein QQF64_030990 [Cirrhinus molitorella]|uniref:Ig-like domain-containing protein n=1 Tax=Cirrhinus molitorella TaxID=172907 RepID=A0ABR3N513_9TELE
MELSLLLIMLLLILNSHPGHTQGQEASEKQNGIPKLSVKPSSVFTGDTVTLICDVGWSNKHRIFWYKNNELINTSNKTETLRNVQISHGGKYACGVKEETRQSQTVMLTVRERPKPVVRVHPDGRVFRGQMVTLTCDIQETDVSSWNYTWNKDDKVIHVSQSQDYQISSVNEFHTGHYSCSGRETQGSRYSHTSDKVTLTVSGSSEVQLHALLIGVIAGLSVAFLLVFILALLFRCKHEKGGGSPSSDHQLQNISQTSEHQKKSGQTTPRSDIVIGHSDLTYIKIDVKSMNQMKKNKENKEKENSNTVYSNLKL